MTLPDTLPGRLAHFAAQRGDEPAMRHKHLGLWQEIGWREYFDRVAAVARMLWELGVRPTDHVAILSDNRPQWLYADLGAQLIGARAVGIYQTSPAQDVLFILEHCGAVVLFCEDQEQVDKLTEIAKQTPKLRHVVVFEPRGTRGYPEPRLRSWDDFVARGQELLASEPEFVSARLADLDAEAPSMVVYTSGTTGRPRGALLSSAGVLAASDEVARLYAVGPRDSVLSYLPLCHVAEKLYSVFLPLSTGLVVHFGESIDTVQEDLREVSPTLFLGVPRIWEKMHAALTIRMQNSSLLKRALFDYFARKGRELAEREHSGARTPLDAAMHKLGDLLIYRPLQERLGLRRCRVASSGAAPIAPDLLACFHGIGIGILEAYGMTELGGASHLNLHDANRIGTVGRPLPLLEQRIAQDGELLLRGPSVFVGYLGDEAATRATIDESGFLHTGDLAAIDDAGFVTITGRKKEVIITSGGKNLSPEKIENALKTSPYIKETVVVGDGRKFVAALVQIDYDTVGEWAARRALPYTSYGDLAEKQEVVALVGEEIARCNRALAPVEQIKQYRLLPKELHQDDGELTATQKVRRAQVSQRYHALIDTMFGHAAR